MSKPESEFLTWFVKQHGPREAGPTSDDELRRMKITGERASDELQRREEWDARHQSALYAWQARERA